MSMSGHSSIRLRQRLPAAMKEQVRSAVLFAYGAVAAQRKEFEFLFILAHMRAGSSLLAMLLGNSEEICGYGEAKLAYHRPTDLKRLTGNNLYRLQPLSLPGRERYMMDKLVNSRLLAPEDLTCLVPAISKFIFLIREPEGALRSLVAMGNDELLAATAYLQRLEMLERYAQVIGDSSKAMALTYHDLTHKTERTLASLALFLELQEPLSPQYELLRPMQQRTTRHNPKLRAGAVDAGRSRHNDIELSAHNLPALWDAYERCRRVLSAECAAV